MDWNWKKLDAGKLFTKDDFHGLFSAFYMRNLAHFTQNVNKHYPLLGHCHLESVFVSAILPFVTAHFDPFCPSCPHSAKVSQFGRFLSKMRNNGEEKGGKKVKGKQTIGSRFWGN